MKKLSLFVTVAILAACTKDDTLAPEVPGGTLTVQKSNMADQMVMPGTRRIAQYTISSSADQLALTQLTFTIKSSVPRSNLQGFYVEMREVTGRDTVTVFATQPGGQVPETFSSSRFYFPLQKGKTYVLNAYAAMNPYMFGTVNALIRLAYDKQDGTSGETPEVEGQTMTVSPYKAYPKLAKVSTPETLTNGTESVLNKFEYESVGGKTSVKQFTFGHSLADNGTNDTLVLKNLKFFQDGADITSKVAFTNQAGATITQTSESDSKVYVTFSASAGESVIEKGSKTTFELRATPSGFVHQNDGDAIGTQLIMDQYVASSGYTYLSRGVLGNNAKLSNISGSSGNFQVFNFIWSDYSAGSSHSAIYGVSSNDWFNGYGLQNLPANVLHQ